MTNMTNTNHRGRKSKHPELAELCRQAAANIIFDDVYGRDEIQRRAHDWEPLRGIAHCPRAKITEDRWFIRFSMGGRQWTLGTFSLFVASRIHDAAFVKFKSFRTHMPDEIMEKSWLNWSREQAEFDLVTNEPLIIFFNGLSAFWKSHGCLIDAPQRQDKATRLAKAYERRRSTQGIVDGAVSELRQFIFDLPTKEDLDRVEKTLNEVKSMLDKLLARSEPIDNGYRP